MCAVFVFLGLLLVAGLFGALVGSWTGGGDAAMIAGIIIAVIWVIYYMFKKH